MTGPSAQEATAIHTRLLKYALEVDDARAFWAEVDAGRSVSAQEAFLNYWFGARSLPRVEEMLANLRLRYGAFPSALHALHRWPHMGPDTRRAICHWHLQLADPLYRRFTGHWLPERRSSLRPEVTRELVVGWVSRQSPGRWTLSTQTQFASKLLSAASAAGLVGSRRDPRPLLLPRVTDEALEYLLYLLRETRVEGTLLANAYLASVGLEGPALEHRLRKLNGLTFHRQGDLIDFGWRWGSLRAWAEANLTSPGAPCCGGVQ